MISDRPRAWNSTLPVPAKPMGRGKGLAQGKSAATRRAQLRPVSKKRARENRERAAMADRLWPDRREGTVMCAVPRCPQRADDLNEILPRGRGGSITDEANCIPLCRPHHEVITFTPDSELEWAYSLGLKKHSWDADRRPA